MSDQLTAMNRARGALVGLAAGNAVGLSAECKPWGKFQPITDMVGGGRFELKPGQWSADASMALCMAESLAMCGRQDPSDQMRRWLRWLRTGYLSPSGRCVGISSATKRQLERFEATGQPCDPDKSELIVENASLSRVIPVAIRWATDIGVAASEAAASSQTTHPARRTQDACRLLGAITAALVQGLSREQVFHEDFWAFGDLHERCLVIARGSWRVKVPPEISGSGCCMGSLEAAIWAAAGSQNFRDAVLRATNLGGDSDTTAAIAGSLAGAIYGENQIPVEWLSRLALRNRIASLADALYRAATGDRLRWPHDNILHAWWVDAEGLVLAGEYPGFGSGDESMRASLELLAQADIRLIVDLTTESDGLPQYMDQLRSIKENRGVSMRRVSRQLAIRGFPPPSVCDQITSDIRAVVEAGHRVYVHCSSGVERTSAVAALWHATNGCNVPEAFRRVRESRHGTRREAEIIPETPEHYTGVGRMARRANDPARKVVTTISREIRHAPCARCALKGGIYSQFDSVCPSCAGRGWQSVTQKEEQICTKCNGFGVAAITLCDPCEECDGRGHHVLLFEFVRKDTTVMHQCDLCGGRGYRMERRRVEPEDCERCGGSGVDFEGDFGRCPDCGGGERQWGYRREEVECGMCDGQGRRIDTHSERESILISRTGPSRDSVRVASVGYGAHENLPDSNG